MSDATRDSMPERISGRVRETLQALFGDASVSAMFSEPVHVGEDVIITAASWERAGGFGFGGGSDGQEDEAGGGGGGGGGSSVGRPVAVIRIGPNGIDVKPVIDFTKVGVTVLLSALAVWKILRS